MIKDMYLSCMAKTTLRKEIMLDAEELQLIRFAMKCSGLDMTTTMRLLIRQQIIEMIIQWRQRQAPRLPADLEKLINEF